MSKPVLMYLPFVSLICSSILAYNRPAAKCLGSINCNKYMSRMYGPGDYVPPVCYHVLDFPLDGWCWDADDPSRASALYYLMRAHTPGIGTVAFSGCSRLRSLLPYLANAAGWIMTEIGRQPWIVFGLLKTAQGVSPTVGFGSVLISLTGLYLALWCPGNRRCLPAGKICQQRGNTAESDG